MTLSTCLNCSAPLAGPYCSACGQRAGDLRRPFAALAGEAIGAALNVDSRALRTLGLALVAPGRLARRYADGKRARYLGPANLYAVATFVFFLSLHFAQVGLVVLLPDPNGGIGLVVSEPPGSSPSDVRVVRSGFTLETFVPLAAARERARAGTSTLPSPGGTHGARDAATRARLEAMLGAFAALTRNPERTNALLEEWLPRLLLLLVPLFALVLKAVAPHALLFEHAVLSLYFHAALFVWLTAFLGVAASTASRASPLPLGAAFLGVAAALLGFSLRPMYGGGWLALAARCAGCLAGYGVAFAVAFNALVLFGLR